MSEQKWWLKDRQFLKALMELNISTHGANCNTAYIELKKSDNEILEELTWGINLPSSEVVEKDESKDESSVLIISFNIVNDELVITTTARTPFDEDFLDYYLQQQWRIETYIERLFFPAEEYVVTKLFSKFSPKGELFQGNTSFEWGYMGKACKVAHEEVEGRDDYGVLHIVFGDESWRTDWERGELDFKGPEDHHGFLKALVYIGRSLFLNK